MNTKLLTTIVCMILIVTLPLTYAQFPSITPSAIGPKEDIGEAIVLNVADYEPKPIPQSALENQNVPIFIYLKGTTLGSLAQIFASETNVKDPMTGFDKIPPIKDITVTPQGDSSKYVAGIPKYIRPKNRAFSLDNLGTLVVTLKQLPEKDTPKTIDLNFTAKIYYDLEEAGLFGISTQDFIIKPYQVESEWMSLPDYQKNPFFSGRGFIRLVSVTEDTARFIFYDRSLSPIFFVSPASSQGPTSIQSKSVTEGQTSEPITIGESGNPFLDSFRIRVNKILTPQDKAFLRISVNGKQFEKPVVAGSNIFSGSNWKVRSISADMPVSIRDHNTLKNKIKSLVGYEVTKEIPLPVYEFSHKIELEDNNGNIVPLETSILTKDESGKQGIFDQIYENLDVARAVSLESYYCLDESEYACKAVSDFKRIIKDYSSSTVTADAYFGLAEIYDNDLIPDKSQPNYKLDMNNLARYYYSKSLEFENFNKRAQAQERLDALTQGIRGFVYLPDEGVGVELLRVEKLQEQDRGSVDIIYNTFNSAAKPLTHKYSEYLKDSNGNVFMGEDDDGQFRWIISSISPQAIVVQKYYPQIGTKGESRSLQLDKVETIPVKQKRYTEGKTSLLPQPILETVTVKVTHIDSKVEADITILPGIGSAVSSSNFLVHLPIDQRLFKFSPEQIKDQIKKTEELINKLNKVIDKLDKLVKSWKKTCIVVGTFLVIKNSFLTGSSRAEARKEMSPYYEDKCGSDIQSGNNRDKYKTLDGCFIYYKNDIEKSLDVGEEAIKKGDEEYKKDIADTNPESNYNKFIKAGGTPDEYKLYKRFRLINETVTDVSLKKYASDKLDSIKYESKLNEYEEAKKLAQDLVGQGKEIKPNDLQFALDAIRNAEINRNQPPGLLTPLSNIRSSGDITIDNAKREKFNAVIVSITAGKISKSTFDLVQATEFESKLSTIGAECKQVNTACETKLTGLEKDRIKNNYDENCQRAEYKSSNIGICGDTASFAEKEAKELIKIQKTSPAIAPGNKPVYIKLVDGKIQDLSETYTSDLKEYANQAIRDSYAEQNEYLTGGSITAQYTKDGFAYCYPLGNIGEKVGDAIIGNGDYALVLERYQTTDVKTMSVWNVGPNGKIECGKGDDVQKIHESTIDQNINAKRKITSVLSKAGQCKESGQIIGQVVSGTNLKVRCSFDQSNAAEQNSQPQCIENMDPSDCQLLFNVCDPVMCPSSRCNLGGRWNVDNVIATGVIGSTVLCLPNYKEGVYVPVCLTGILAGLKNIKTILEGYKSCLEVSLNEGKNIGLCDYIRSIGICELMWREAIAIMDVKGGIIDWALGKVSTNRGGGEYLAFSSATERASKSFNYFTTTYSNTLLAQYKGKSKAEIGTEICKLAVAGKMPNVGDVLDQLSEPEDPPQFVAVFDEAPSITRAGVDPSGRTSAGLGSEQSIYTGFYHIYAGNPPKGFGLNEASKYLQYWVYLKNSRRLDIPIRYITKNTGVLTQYSTIPFGSYAQESINVAAESGYDQICVGFAGRAPACGFGKTTSDFSIGSLQDSLVVDEFNRNIKTEKDCVPEASRTSPSLSSLTMPQQFGILNSGIVRVCNPVAPGPVDKWKAVGDCGNDKNNKYLGKCWIDMSSVSINDAQKREIVAESAENQSRILLGAGDAGLVPFKDGNYAIGYLDALRKGMMGGIVDRLEKIPTGDDRGIISPKTKAVPTGTAGLGGGKVPNKIDPEINGGCRYDGIFEWNKTVIRIGNPNIVVDRLKNTATNNKVYVYAFASKEGTASYNQRLSNNRANSISNILESSGLNVITSTPQGSGETTIFDDSEKTISGAELAKKEISDNRRFVISTKPITAMKDFLPKTLAGSTSNCEVPLETKITEVKTEPIKSQSTETTQDACEKYCEDYTSGANICIRSTCDDANTLQNLNCIFTKTSSAASSENDRGTCKQSIAGITTQAISVQAQEELPPPEIETTPGLLPESINEKLYKEGIYPSIENIESSAPEQDLSYEGRILAALKQEEQDFLALRTPIEDSPVTDYKFERQYSYDDLIYYAVNSEISAKASLQRGEFYKYLAQLKYDYLIAPLLAVELEKQSAAQQISKYKINYLEPGVEILGDFDTLNYYYVIDFELQGSAIAGTTKAIIDITGDAISNINEQTQLAQLENEQAQQNNIQSQETKVQYGFDEKTHKIIILNDRYQKFIKEQEFLNIYNKELADFSENLKNQEDNKIPKKSISKPKTIKEEPIKEPTPEGKLVYNSISDISKFQNGNFKIEDNSLLKKSSIKSIRVSVYERTEDTVYTLEDIAPETLKSSEVMADIIKTLPTYASYAFQGPSVSKPKEDIKKTIEVVDLCKENCGGTSYDTERCTLSSCEAIGEKTGINCEFTPGVISGNCEQKKAITTKCEDCGNGIYKTCNKEYCEYIGEKTGKSCEYSGALDSIGGDCKEKTPEVTEEKGFIGKTIDTIKDWVGLGEDKTTISKYTLITLNPNSYDLQFKITPVQSFKNSFNQESAAAGTNLAFFGSSGPEGIFIKGKLQTDIITVDEPNFGKGNVLLNGWFLVMNNGYKIIDTSKYNNKDSNLNYAVRGLLLFDSSNPSYSLINQCKNSQKGYCEASRPRTAICIDNQNKIKLFASPDKGMTVYQLANFLKQKGCKDAVQFDSVGSTAIGYKDPKTQQVAISSAENRAMPSILLVKPKAKVIEQLNIETEAETVQTSTQQIPLTGERLDIVVVSDVHEGQEYNTDKLIEQIKRYKPNYIVINGDLIATSGGDCSKVPGVKQTSKAEVNSECYNYFYKKFYNIGMGVIGAVPGNHDWAEYYDKFTDGSPKEIKLGNSRFIFLDLMAYVSDKTDPNRKDTIKKNFDFLNTIKLSQGEKVFLFSHMPFVDYPGFKPNINSLPPSFKSELNKLSGQCALVSGHSHVYATKEDGSTGCLGIGDGRSGGDKRDAVIGSFNDVSFTLLQVYDGGFKSCPIREGKNFGFINDECSIHGIEKTGTTQTNNVQNTQPAGIP